MEKLLNIVNAMNGENIELTSNYSDGRLNSAIDEGAVIEIAKTECEKLGYKFIEAPARHWFDFAFEADGKFYPVNVKISSCQSADNVSSKLGMFYALTGKDPKEVKGINQWEGFINKLFDNINLEGDSDYYFLVVNKTSRTAFGTSLLKLNELTPNGNNLPFQSKWQNNMTFSDRCRQGAIEYVLDMFFESWKRKCNPYETLQKRMGMYSINLTKGGM